MRVGMTDEDRRAWEALFDIHDALKNEPVDEDIFVKALNLMTVGYNKTNKSKLFFRLANALYDYIEDLFKAQRDAHEQPEPQAQVQALIMEEIPWS